MQETNKQAHNKTEDPSLSVPIVMNKLPTRPGCFSMYPARHLECGQFCSLANECHSAFNDALFYGE